MSFRQEIVELINSQDPRTKKQIGQAIRDAQACCQSRRSREPCDCFCCQLYMFVRQHGWDIPKVAKW